MTPDWVHDAVFYQIFPDRFARSGRVEHQERLSLQPWGTDPAEQGFQGGDLLGIVDRLGYLEDLGVTALYLNPIFASAANHRYHTYDYYQVDPILGGNDALRTLLDAAHERGMRVVLDGVFNHASRGFWPFHHVLETGGRSPYVDWFEIEDWPLRPYAPEGTAHNYSAWADLPALPEFNTDHPPVRDYLFGVAEHWVEQGIDGWRLDVPNEIDDDAFWREFRSVVKGANPEAYLVGEIWHEAERWLQGDQFDAVMNYPRLGPVLSFFGAETLRSYDHPHLAIAPVEAPAFAREMVRLLRLYPWPVTCAQLNLLSSHDMPRALWLVGEDAGALRLAMVFQMTMPGAPCIYYGDEVGMASKGDPHCRAAFPWNHGETWDERLRSTVAEAVALRHAHPVLRTGRVEFLHAEGRTLVYRRHFDENPGRGEAGGDTDARGGARSRGAAGGEEGEEALVAFNAGTSPATVRLALEDVRAPALKRAWPPDTSHRLPAAEAPLTLDLPARSARVWIA
jgi:neopullulanase